MNNSPVLQLAMQLISRPSITPRDEGCQALMIERLKAMDFKIVPLHFCDVSNFWAIRGESGPILAFAGHTDVVPTGPAEEWDSPPFEPSIRGDYLYGRGAADMKGSLAAMIVATERFIARHPNYQGKLAYLITSDEEGPAIDGTARVIQHLQQQDDQINWCVVGEPSSGDRLGDTIKNGRRGSLGGLLRAKGIQGHIAYPEKASNPIHSALAALTELTNEEWDQGNDFFPATSFQISNINAGTGATNVIPGELEVVFNFRFSTEITADQLINKVEAVLAKHKVDYTLQWTKHGQPFLTDSGELVATALQSIAEITGETCQLSTSGGTSDGRFIAPTGAQVIELGPCNRSIHKVNECVKISDLDKLALIYEQLITRMFHCQTN